jgi:thiol-disulfide isomerase/thioredoxin/YHS domain-containing protein
MMLGTRGAVADEPSNDPNRWRHDFEKAHAEAKRLDRPLLVHFYADWCLPCQRMEREVLNDAELLQQFGSKFVAVRVNADRHEELLRRFNIQSLPSDVFISPDGRVLERTSGFQSRPLYLLRLELVDAKFTRLIQSTPSGQPITDSPSDTESDRGNTEFDRDVETDNRRPRIVARPMSQSRTVPGKALAGDETISAPKPLVGLDGFSPVSLYNQRKWHKGREAFSAVYQETQYHMASAAELKEFRATPGRYAPRLLGCDPVVLQETDRALNGSTRYAAYFDGELYLFVSAKTRMQFKQSPLRYTRTRHVLRLENPQQTQLR